MENLSLPDAAAAIAMAIDFAGQEDPDDRKLPCDFIEVADADGRGIRVWFANGQSFRLSIEEVSP